jgi:hypothetical protein
MGIGSAVGGLGGVTAGSLDAASLFLILLGLAGREALRQRSNPRYQRPPGNDPISLGS